MDYKVMITSDAEEDLDRFIRYLLFKKKIKSLILKTRNFQYTWIVYLLTTIIVMYIVADKSSVYQMRSYSNRYIFIIYPLAVILVVCFIWYFSYLLSEKRKISSIIALVLSVIMIIWSHLESSYDYLFRHYTDGRTLDTIEADSSCVIVLREHWIITCFAPYLCKTDSFYFTDYWTFQDDNPFENADTTRKYYLIVDQSHIMGDDVTIEEVEENPLVQNRAETAFYEQDFLDFYLKYDNVKDLVYVGTDGFMERYFKIYQVVFEKEK